MNYLFIIQGEGRGHISQAIALKEKIEAEGNIVKKVWIGTSPQRSKAHYAEEVFGDKLAFFRSPNFIKTRDRKGIRPGLSIVYNLLIFPVYFRSIFILSREIRKIEYDRVINFYDMTGGLAAFFSPSNKTIISISHHFFLTSQNFKFPQGYFFSILFLKLHNYFCALRATEIWALSFDKAFAESEERIKIIPPILRKDIFNLKVRDDGFVLVYLLNSGLIHSISSLAEKHPGIEFKVFIDEAVNESNLFKNIKHFGLHPELFLTELSNCHCLITTAGFESQCEAAYLGKTVYTLPSKNHFEQTCNAIDGERSGISQSIREFNPEIQNDLSQKDIFKKWCLTNR